MKMTRLALGSYWQGSLVALSAMALCLFVTLSGDDAVAQEGVADGELEEIVVRGIRGSLQEASTIKRSAGSFVEAVVSEDVGKFPDVNAAEALQRVPGISIERSFGEGSHVAVRGFSSDLNLTLLNGQPLAASGRSRSFSYEILPSEMIGTIEVYKTPEARLHEGGVGGTIIVNTRKPLSLDEGWEINTSAQWAYDELDRDSGVRSSGAVGYKSDDGTFGVLGSLAYSDFDKRTDRIEAWAWAARHLDADGDGTPEYPNVLVPIGANYLPVLEKIERIGANGVLQWRPSGNFELEGNYFFAQRLNQRVNLNYAFTQNYAVINDIDIQGDRLVSIDLGTPADAGRLRVGQGPRDEEQSTASMALKGTWTNQAWTSTAQVGYTKGTFRNPRPSLFALFIGSASTFIDLSQDNILQAGTHSADIQDASILSLRRYRVFETPITDEDGFFQLDFNRELSSNFLSSIEFGASIRDHANQLQEFANSSLDFGAATAKYSDFLTDGPPGFLDDVSTLPNVLNVRPFLDHERLRGAFGDIGRLPLTESASVFGRIEEDIVAAYLQLNVGSDISNVPAFGEVGIRGSIGVRVVDTTTTSFANEVSDPVLNPGVFSRVSATSGYTDVLPSANLVFDLTDDLVFRMSASKVTARPSFADLNPAVVTNLGSNTGNGGQPGLDPFRADAYDVGLEWYRDNGHQVFINYFYKDIESFVATIATEEDYSHLQEGCCVISRPFNGDGGSIAGLEMGFQGDFSGLPGLLSNFGGIVNVGLTDSESNILDVVTGEPTAIPGLSEQSVNGTLYYEDNRWSGRLAYTWRDEFLTAFLASHTPGISAPYNQLDVSLQFAASDGLTLTLEVVNLTKETEEVFIGEEFRPLSNQYSGRRFYLGARLAF